MADQLSIHNLALLRLGEMPIPALDYQAKRAVALASCFEAVRDIVIQDHPWNFAVARAALTELATPPEFGFAHSFILPADCLRVLGLVGTGEDVDPSLEYRLEGQMLAQEDLLVAPNLISPDGTVWQLTVADDGELTPVALYTGAQVAAGPLLVSANGAQWQFAIDDVGAVNATLIIPAGLQLLTNESVARIKYIRRVTNLDVMTPRCTSALASRLAAEVCNHLTTSPVLKKQMMDEYRWELAGGKEINGQEGSALVYEPNLWMEARA